MLCQAKFEDTEEYRDFGGKERLIEMPRGTLTHSIRFMSKAFGWSTTKLIKFLKDLENDESIVQKPIQQITQITICNYDLYQDTETQKSNGKKTARKQQENEIKKDKNIYSGKKFIPPTYEEVKNYADSIGYGLNVNTFLNSYEQKGWMVGKNKMKDWKAAVRNWKTNGWGRIEERQLAL